MRLVRSDESVLNRLVNHDNLSMSTKKQMFVSPYIQQAGPTYLDCNATSPMEPKVRDALVHWFSEELGNAGSRTHEYGLHAKKAVQTAREHVAEVVSASADEIVFTSGATESNNIAILGLADYGEKNGRRHVVSTAIEHKAVLEPLEALEKKGFKISLAKPDSSGVVSAQAIQELMQPETLLVSVMQVNNETGARQPVAEIASRLAGHHAYFHVDAAQGFGKELAPLRSPRIDLISISSHKVYGPVGVGALVARRRSFKKPPLASLAYGGGQERGLRPGTLPVPLIVGFGVASEIARENVEERRKRCTEIRAAALAALSPLDIRLHTAPDLHCPTF